MTLDELLIRLLGSTDLPPHLRTYVAEAVALVESPSDDLVAVLLQQLQHERAYVREGALLGCAHVAHRPDVRAAIEAASTSPTLAEIALELHQPKAGA